METMERTAVADRVGALVEENRVRDAGQVLEGFIDQALEIEDRVWALLELARLHEGQGASARAVEAYEQVLQLDPSHAEENRELGRIYGQTNRWKEFIDLLEGRLLFLDDPAKQAEACMGIAELHQARFANQAAAIEALERALLFSPSHAEAIARLASLYEARRDWQNLRGLYERALAHDPNHAEARRALDRLDQGGSAPAAPQRRPWWKFW
jgi:tetratricopeptide (TPR) repeat protein